MHRNELVNREAKMERLVAFLEEHGKGFPLAETLGIMSDAAKAEICKLAGEKRPASEQTWNMVRAELARRERMVAA